MSNRLGTKSHQELPVGTGETLAQWFHTEDARYRARASTDRREPERSQLISRVTDAVMDDVRPGCR